MHTSPFTTPDGTTIFTKRLLPETTPRAAVIIVHGINEHSGRYNHVMEHLVTHGYAAYTLDHRGFGRSSGLRAYIERFSYIVDDLKLYFDQVRAEQPHLPIFLLGHSLGTLISLSFALRYQDQLSGMVINGSPLFVEQAVNVPPFLRALANVLNIIVPKAALIQFGGQRDNMLSNDPTVAERWEDDPLTYKGKTRVRTALEIQSAIHHVIENLSKLTLPMFITHGAQDELALPQGSEMIYKQARSADKTLKMYEDMQHEIYNEYEKQVPLNDVVEWLNAHTTPPESQTRQSQGEQRA